jgi:gliding motility-associated-like protein
VTVKDSLGCTSTASFDLNKDVLKIDTNLLQFVSCPGQNDGSFEVIPSGGTPFGGGTYLFTWSQNPAANGRSVTSTNNMVGGKGFVIVEDAVGCVDTVFYDIPSLSDIELQVSIDSVLCHGDSTGRIILVATTNGVSNPPYLFILRRPNGLPVTGGSVLLNEYRHNNLWAGTFTLRLDDASGCVYRDTFTIGEPDPLDVIIVDADTSAGCSPGNDAFIEVNGFAGSGGPFIYQWDFMNHNGPRLDSLTSGQYTVEIRDKNDCPATRTFDISGAVGPMITGFDIKGIGCAGDTSGSVTVMYSVGDTSIQDISWSNNRSGEMISGLSEGEYIVTITDYNGCTAIDTAVIDIPMNSIRITSVIIDTPSCNGLYDGFLQLNVDGGVKPYSFQWSNNVTDSILTNIGAGRYIIAIRDQSNCPPIIDTFDIPEPPSITIDLLSVDGVSCNNDTTCDGRAIAVASDGPDASAGYNFIWSSGEIGRSSPDTAVNLCKGQQLLIVANGDCVDSLYFDVSAPDPISVDFASSQFIKPSCAGRDDGSISIISEGGTGSRRVRWDFGPTSDQIDNLSAGVYYFIVEDDNGCIIADSIVLKDPDSLNAFILDAASRDISCPGGSDGRIVVTWSGGNAGQANFNWSPNVTQDSIGMDLSSGNYNITVTDSRGCIDTLIYNLVEPPAIMADFPLSDSVDCFGSQLPVTVVAAMGGNGPEYSFGINNGPRRGLGEEVNLFAGSYLITVFDKDGCRIDSTITIHQPGEINVDLGPPQIELDLGDSIRLCFQTNIPNPEIDSIVWRPSAPLADPDGRCIWVKANNDITYFLEVYNQDGCVATDEIRIIVNKSRRVFAPNVFNPNGTVNTKWKVFTGKGVETIESISIFDRWGEIVYQKEQPNENDGWNGNFQNTTELMPNGVYIYMIKVRYLDGNVEVRKGDITLYR